MAFNNTNKGVLFKNEKSNDAQPDYKGSVNVDGVEYWFSGWIKTAGPQAKNPGMKFLSVAVEKKDAEYQKPAPYQSPPLDDDDDIPF